MDLLKTKALSLYLRPTLPEDKGEYRCTLTLKDAIHVHTVFLNVSVPPTIIKSPVPYLKVDEGAVLELNCLANGDPPPQVTWKIHSNPLVTEDKGEHKLLSIYEAFSELGVLRNKQKGWNKTIPVCATLPRLILRRFALETAWKTVALAKHFGIVVFFALHQNQSTRNYPLKKQVKLSDSIQRTFLKLLLVHGKTLETMFSKDLNI
ncbi:unnamed protein product [Trichobilharzia regenti]|nr:unnamed protein product [Trichobilharzia regenti]